ncbi:SDR family oxidoreductase [Streptosporangium sp. NPDC001681]|uniref:SDR family NAD(P)-dependent oxidoreductase n=1 Tax=Streptosporangium sp. NPDC001681 TaxID=3154395 RepID=UPI0033305744
MAGLPEFDVAGQVVIVTGAGRGIGRALALDLAASSATVVAVSRTRSDLDALQAEIEEAGGEAVTVVADLATTDGARTLVEEAVAACGRIDGLVNNVGWDVRRDAVDYTEDEVDRILSVNLKAAYWTSVYAAKRMLEQGTGGAIVNVASQAGILGSHGRAPYSAAKAGLLNLTRSLATEWGRAGIRVNALAPGVTLTDPVRMSLAARPHFAAEVRERILLGRPADPREVGLPILFLLSPAAAMITGQTLVVDGGWTAAWSVSKADGSIV